MSRKTIAVDVDDVLSVNVPAFLEFSNKKWGTSFTIDDFDEDWSKMWKISHAEVMSRSKEMDEAGLVRDHKHLKDALPVLQKLSERYDLIIVTARRKVLKEDTDDWIDRYFPNIFKEIHFAGIWDDIEFRDKAHKMTKGDLVKQVGAEYLIDDQPKHCFAAADVGVVSILFGDYPWNRDVDATSNRLVRAHSWGEIGKYFDAQA